MSILTGGYVGAKACTSGPTVGAKNLMAWYLRDYKNRGTNLGIYNCRPVRGGTTTSLHGEGRAADLGTPTQNSWSWELAEFLRANSRELGIQCIIHNRRIWSSGGGAGWRNYTGVAAHFDHLHVELTWWAANGGLTVDLLTRTRSGAPGPSPVVSSAVLQKGSKGPAVTRLQERLVKLYPAYAQTLGKLVVDGDFGPTTYKWVCEFQRRSRLPVDGVVGPNTARALGL